jgi:pSer/pThr/pTyr-binding forkhead associated (FHA) protein
MFKLVIADDEGKTTVVPLVRDEITIGRKEGNTIRLTERNISRRHAKLRKTNGAYLVEDLQSYNGVKVNGRRIGGELSLKAGDQITIGDYQLALQLDDGATTVDTVAPSGSTTSPSGDAPTALIASPPAAPTAETTDPAVGADRARTSARPARSTAPPARIVMTSPPAPGAEFALSKPLVRIGRAEELDIWVNHRSISREHAEITNDQGQLKVRDLGSANGIRVNGREVQQSDVKPGDVLELGQVRFRVVAPGETFVFDAASTIQMDAVGHGGRAPSRAPLLVAVAIVGVAVVGAVGVALSGSDGTTVTPIADATGGPTSTAPTVTAVRATPGAGATTATAPPGIVATPTAGTADPNASCEASIASGDYPAAAGYAEEALRARPDDGRAIACRSRAEQLHTESLQFADGVRQLEEGNLDGAYLAFDALPRESAFRSRPEVQQTMERFATTTLAAAQALLAGDPTQASLRAQMVGNMVQGPTRAQRAQAQQLVQRAATGVASARREGEGRTETATAAASATASDGRRDPEPTSPSSATSPSRTERERSGSHDRERGTRTPRGTEHASTAARPPETPSAGSSSPAPGTTTPTPGPASTAPTETPLAAAQACLARGDNPCVIRALEGRARTAQEYRLLLETYRAMGNTPRMLDTMERFVQRFASDVRTPAYRQVLLQHGR